MTHRYVEVLHDAKVSKPVPLRDVYYRSHTASPTYGSVPYADVAGLESG